MTAQQRRAPHLSAQVMLRGQPLFAARLDRLPMRAHTALQNARSRLMDMAVDCLNHAWDWHVLAIDGVLVDLHEALAHPVAPQARARLRLLCDQLSHLRGDTAPLSLDDLGTRYAVAEMRIAVLILADRDERLAS